MSTIVYISAMTFMAGGRSIKQMKDAVKGGLLRMQKMSWIISPLSMITAQNFLPQQTWVPFFSFIAFGKSKEREREGLVSSDSHTVLQ